MSNVGDNNSDRTNPRGGAGSSSLITRFTNALGAISTAMEGRDTRVYASKQECYVALIAAMDKYPSTRDCSYDNNCNYSAVFNSWNMATGFDVYSYTVRSFAKREGREARVEYTQYLRWETRQGCVELQVTQGDQSKKIAQNKSCWKVFTQVRKLLPTPKSIQQVVIRTQSDETPQKLTEQGDATQLSEKENNTIITRDQQEVRSDHSGALDRALGYVSTEPIHRFPTLINRWMPLKSFEITTNQSTGDIVKTYYLPQDLYSEATKAPNLIPFETFVYGRMTIELRLITNANKFHVGKIVMSSKYDSYQADTIQSGFQSALNRNHVIVDLTANNEAVLEIPFRYHRPFIRLSKTNATKGMRTGKYCSVYIHVLSPLQTGPDGSSTVGARVYYRIKDCEFAGMSYRVDTQMFGIEQLLTSRTKGALREILVGAEKAFDQLGASSDRDKPGTTKGEIIIPRPRMNFCTGKGIIDVTPLRINPYTQTNGVGIRVPDDEPRSFYDLARIWGIYKTFKWSKDKTEGQELISFILDPMMRNYDTDYVGEPTPLEYACAQYAFWNGTIEMRLDFVSNAFHTGTVQISAEFGRLTNVNTESESSSTYVKNFHLGEQKTVSFRVPYIYDTLMRRTTANMVNPYMDGSTNDDIKNRALTIAPLSQTYIKVKVINPLRPVTSAPQTIEVLVFVRAGDNFSMHGLKGNSMLRAADHIMDNFPYDYQAYSRTSQRTLQLGINNGWNEVDSRYHKVDKSMLSWNRAGTFKDLALTDPNVVYNSVSSTTVAPSTTTPTKGVAKAASKGAVRTQMDNGEKETLDATDDFNQGPCAVPLITSDCHMVFKDLLRRPCMIIDSETVETGEQCEGYFIPLMPPQRDMHLVGGQGGVTLARNGIWAPNIMYHTTSAITGLFRCWRGSMRYTIIMIPEDGQGYAPVYVSLIPHSGVRKLGKWNTNGGYVPMHGQSFITEMIIPRINNTVTIEVPYDTENTWTLMHEDDSTLNYAWRDKGDTNAGHLVISSRVKHKMHVWWSAGDDFEVANFFGVPRCKDNGWAYRWDDTHGKVQSDFEEREYDTTVGRLINGAKRVLTPKNIIRTGVSCIPVVGTGLVTASVVNDMEQVVRGTSQKVGVVADKIVETADNFNISIESFKGLLDGAVKTVADTIGHLVNGVNMLYDILLDIFSAWSTKSWIPVGTGIVRLLGKLLVVGTDKMGDLWTYGNQLAVWISNFMSDPVPTIQADTGDTPTLLGLLLGIVGTICDIHLDPWRSRPYTTAFVSRITSVSGVAYFVQVLRFVQGIFGAVRNLIMEAFGYVSPEAMALRMLSDKNGLIANFVSEAQIITSEANGSIINLPCYRVRFWKTVLQAYQLQKIMCMVPTNAASGSLVKLCTDVIKLANEKFMDVAASPVRYEPMVIFIEGGAGVGKSFISEVLAHNMLQAIGFSAPAAGETYQRTPGERFWSGYRDQPVIVYDEYMNSNDSERCTQMVIELQKLKSTACFIPEMAELGEKKIRGNPLIVMIVCNGAFPSVSDYARYPEAVNRRREVVLRVTRAAGYEGKDLRKLSMEEKADYKYLDFQCYKRPWDKESLGGSIKKYVEVMPWLQQKFKFWHTTEQQNVRARMQMIPGFFQGENDMKLEDPFALFYSMDYRIQVDGARNNGWTPLERLETAVNMIDQAFEEHQEDVCREPEVVEDPDWETYKHMPTTQSWTLSGFLSAFTPIKYFAGKTMEWLQTFEDSMDNRPRVLGLCTVCQETTFVGYTCQNTVGKEEPHYVCLTCWRGLLEFTKADCPVCRCSNLVPTLDKQDLTRLVVWRRMMIQGCRSLQWFADKVRKYYNWREDHHIISIWIDYITDVLLGIKDLKSGKMPTGSYALGAMWGRWASVFVNMVREPQVFWNAMTQSDDDWEIERGETPERMIQADKLNPTLNVDFLEEVELGFSEDPVCFHNIDTNIGYVEARIDCIKVLDERSHRYVSVSYYPCCISCPFRNRKYREDMFQQMLDRQKNSIRSMYIDYINNPSEELRDRIPPLFRPMWMKEIKVSIDKNWWTYMGNVWDNYKNAIVYLGAISTVIASVVGVYRMVYQTVGDGRVQNALGTMGSAQHASPRHRKVDIRLARGPQRFAPTSGVVDDLTRIQSTDGTPVVLDVVKKYIVNNTVKMVLTGDSVGVGKVMYGIGIFNHYMLMPRHYVKQIMVGIAEGKVLWIEPEGKPQMRIKFEPKLSDFVLGIDTDIAYVKVPPSFPLFKNIVKFMALEEDFQKPISAEAELLCCPTKQHPYFMLIPIDLDGVEPSRIIVDAKNETFEAKEVLVYNYSEAGACGSLALRPKHTRPILSMHFAGAGLGTDGKGYGIILTQESLKDIMNNTVVTQVEDVEYGPIEEAQFIYDDEVAINYLGSLPKEKVPFIPHTSRLVKSALWGKEGLEVDVEPAILDKHDPRYRFTETPLHAGVRKHGKITKDFSQEELRWAEEALWDMYYQNMKPIIAGPKVLSETQAVLGLDNEYYKPMDMSTSAGYPYILGTRKKKHEFIEFTLNAQLQPVKVKLWDPQLREELERKRELRKQGIVPISLFIDTLKDEKRPKEKVLKLGGTRVFCNGPMDEVIEDRRYFMHFIAAFMKHRHSMQHMVGMNPMASEWTAMTNSLLSYNSKFMTLDYTNFGPGYNSGVAQVAYSIMKRWTIENVKKPDWLTGDEYARTLDALTYKCLQSHHIVSNTVYHQVAGSPSGATYTTYVNSIVNQLYVLLAWRRLCGEVIHKQGKSLIKEYKRCVKLYVYGDDAIMAVKEEYVPLFNMRTIIDYFSAYGISATNSTKGEQVKEYESIDEATFLRRGFRRHDVRDEWTAPLAWDSILGATQWVWRSENLKESTQVNVSAALLQAHGHGKQKFEAFKSVLAKHMKRVKMVPPTESWEELDELLYSGQLKDLDAYINF